MTVPTLRQIVEAFERGLIRRNTTTEYKRLALENWTPYKLNKKEAVVKLNKDIFTFSSYSVFQTYIDPDCMVLYCNNDVSDDILGGLLIDVLDHSPTVTLRSLQPEADSLQRPDMDKFYEQWVAKHLEVHGYKNRKAFFTNLLHCSVTDDGEKTIICPSNHYVLEGWNNDGLAAGGVDNIVIPSNSKKEEMGRALRLAFAKCIDGYAEKQRLAAEKKQKK